MTSRRVLAVIPMLHGGGAERAMAAVCSALAAAGHEVTLLTTFPSSAEDYPLDPRCARESLDLGGDSSSALGAILNNWRRVRALRRRIRAIRPHAVLSFLDSANVVTILAAAGLGARVVVVEQVDPRMHLLPFPWPQLRRITYPLADRVVVLTEGMARDWGRPLFGTGRITVIPNPMAVRLDAGGASEPGRFMLAVGRFTPQKGFDTLLRAYAAAARDGLEEELVILGDGPDRDSLQSLAASLGIEARVRLPGRTSDIARWYRGARAFVLSSRFEGLPLALLEAMAFGVPCVATDCRSGPAELLAGGAGILVPVDDVSRLSAAMLSISADDDLRSKVATRAREVVAAYTIEALTPQWIEVLGLDA